MNKFFPSYVGSKSYWISELNRFKNKDFVELFCGSSVLSANLAKTSVLNDLDPMVYQILSEFDKLIVPEEFTKDDFNTVKKYNNWWQYSYCLQKMSFSGVFRYSKNGYNVPMKKDFQSKNIYIQDDYNKSLARWHELKPTCLNMSYCEVPKDLLVGKVVILDPPYETSKASYNTLFDYERYWDYVKQLEDIAETIIIFDRYDNLKHHGIEPLATRKMRVNGSKKGDIEAIGLFEENAWRTLF